MRSSDPLHIARKSPLFFFSFFFFLFFFSYFFFLMRMVVLWICCGLKPAREAGGMESMGSVAVFSRLPRHALSLYGGRVLKRRGKGAGRVNRGTGNGAATRSAVSGSLPPFSTHYVAVKRYPRQALCYSVLACAPSFRVQGCHRPRSWHAFRTVGGKR